jgi:CRISPR system Cascade subunit CasB
VDAVQKVARQRDSKSVEQRFVALLDADADELVWRLRHLVQLVASEGVSIDWPALLADLLAWQHPERRVQQRWARQYWRVPAAHPDAPAPLDAAE